MPLGEMFRYPKNDVVAGVVVFLVALPLCLGIAVASGVPPVSGLIAGAVGGLVVPFISRSPLSVSGPAAGLAAIVLTEVEAVGLPHLLCAVALAGVMQIGLGLLRTGRYSILVPSAVVSGMLAAIGALIILKQVPAAAGVKTLPEIPSAFHPGAVLIAIVSLVILFGWKHTPLKGITWLPAALVAVGVGTGLSVLFAHYVPALALDPKLLVSVPTGGIAGLAAAVPRPDLTGVFDGATWVVALTLAIVASLETLLSVQAVDRLDPLNRKSPPDRELVAQGVGNLVSGLLGGMPLTAVIVRSGANVAAGGRERLSAFVHGILLLLAVLAGAALLNYIPLACLAAVLIQVGLNLCRPALFRAQYKLGAGQFAPFLITIAAILIEDLLIGVVIGIVVGVIFVLRQNARGAIEITESNGRFNLRLRRDGTFITKPALQAAFDRVPEGGEVVFDATGEYVDHDLKELVAGYQADAKRRNIRVQVVGLDMAGVGVGGH